jgi:hypothetical protein
MSGFWNASVVVLTVPAGIWAAFEGQWGLAALFIVGTPFAAYEAVMKFKAGNWWYAGSRSQ